MENSKLATTEKSSPSENPNQGHVLLLDSFFIYENMNSTETTTTDTVRNFDGMFGAEVISELIGSRWFKKLSAALSAFRMSYVTDQRFPSG